ncbi:carbonic anhydrase [Nannocystis sp. ILAH1]|uniref:carbonic anhydrase n=1 Tax=unclassified Nannocystis TaxID=2627009 RepID=UPI00226FB4D2|nr:MULTISPECIES: carbonic anhydrase [unclassified Nannocystis]MCY0987059.1 carbonic anhydrase [Nannocystis sp. ILAH1]MCY1071942.1 carbonic anhydrase [Nannocystis sp. RBIL2]
MNPARRLLLANKSWAQERRAIDPEFFQRLAAGQQPEFLWISCSDSRVPETQLTVTDAGELFVHRNVANLVRADDTNVLCVIQYAIEALKVHHVIVCGHYGCGGVKAAMNGAPPGRLSHWLAPVAEIYQQHRQQLDLLTEDERWAKLVELNTVEQVHRLAETDVIRNAWANGEYPYLHAWVYSLPDGLIQPLLTLSPKGPQKLL